MPGGKGNIKPEDGIQFKKGNKAAEKWTEKRAIDLGNEMIDWLNEKNEKGKDVGNILFEEFLIMKKNLYVELPTYLRDKFTSFSKLYNIAKKTQEIKIMKYGLAERLNASMCKFILSADHGKTITENKNIDQKTTINLDEDTFQKIRKNIEDNI